MSKRNTYITGTLRADQKRNQTQVVGKRLRKGEMVFMSLGDISVSKWKDKRGVYVISNAHVPALMDSVNRHGKSKWKPSIIHIYNNHMLGISRSNQMLSYHSALWETIRWYKKAKIQIMEIFFNNDYYMHAKNTTNSIAKNMKDFQESIVTNLTDPPPPNRYLMPQASFHPSLLQQQQKKRKMLPEHANTATRTKSVKNQGMSVCSAPINQCCVLIRVFACFIRTLMCSKKKHNQVLKTNSFPANNAFCIL